MAANYLTREDEQNFGPELLDVAQRAAWHAVAPELQQLREENQDLQNQLNATTKTTIDRELDAAVPDWRQINADERFHRWLLMPEPYSGIIRDRLLKDAVAAANAQRVVSIFQGYLREAGAAEQAPAGPAPRRAAERRPVSGSMIDPKLPECGICVGRGKSTTKLGSGGNTNFVGPPGKAVFVRP